ncbi:MAG: bifunctional adenosylcobinamide kinase/adenosylcobinamide-phosphate guanylyltransferase [Rhodospirillum sp.]|nr:bifunctional adenosylcobinamide kinase/adenosylcobinamide-phosphate guanylyltransferase [Rhodospirillum sp.]MCF8488675.1 bifunctional adenosylcobinamide kinase/adenosylcobinamide-phosphate guanylyltransferase [Rhodospirillum sp.]MCF8502561.1 bifunctional adenosylcobinamide kinase/adenosylcobinamide-phosphate guanylyltransferase [Rhodospirillum sp.]
MAVSPFDPNTAPPGPRITLVLGGARSGKSALAERIVAAHAGQRLYVATAQAFDEEMKARIAAHRDRRDSGWETVEAPMNLPAVLMARGKTPEMPVLVDCLSLWLSNLMLAERPEEPAISALEAALANSRAPVVLVSNEVGLSIVPDTPLGRRFRDAQGILNQRVAALAGRVILCVAGLPILLKDLPEEDPT